jgi:hypothetical protein
MQPDIREGRRSARQISPQEVQMEAVTFMAL